MGGNGAERSGEEHAAEDDCGRDGTREGAGAAWREFEYGVLCAAIAGCSGCGFDGAGTVAARLSDGWDGSVTLARRRVSVFGRGCGQADPCIVGRREVAPGDGADVVQSAEFSG